MLNIDSLWWSYYMHHIVDTKHIIHILTFKTSSSTDKSTWEHTDICRSYGARSSPMWCVSCSVSAAGSTVSCPTFTVLQDPPDLTRLVGWATRPSRVSPELVLYLTAKHVWSVVFACLCNHHVFVWFKQATSSTVSVCAVEAVNALSPRVLLMASQCTMASTRSSLPAVCSPLLRYTHDSKMLALL